MSKEKLMSSNTNDVIYLQSHARFYSVIAKLFSTCDGRDKFMKVIQYTLALLMYVGIKPYNLLPRFQKRIQAVMTMFGDTRKVIRLGNFTSNLAKLIYLVQGKGVSPNAKLHPIDQEHYNLLIVRYASEMVNNITDDLYCLAKFGILDKWIQPIVKPISIKLWWTTLSIDMFLNSKKLLAKKTQVCQNEFAGKDRDTKLDADIDTLKWTMVKIAADMIFCSYDLFHIDSNIEYQHTSGIVSGLISANRLWSNTYNSTTY